MAKTKENGNNLLVALFGRLVDGDAAELLLAEDSTAPVPVRSDLQTTQDVLDLIEVNGGELA